MGPVVKSLLALIEFDWSHWLLNMSETILRRGIWSVVLLVLFVAWFDDFAVILPRAVSS